MLFGKVVSRRFAEYNTYGNAYRFNAPGTDRVLTRGGGSQSCRIQKVRIMSIEEEKIEAIRHYLLDALPGYDVRDGSRTHVDRTLTVFHGLEIVCTVQIPTALLDEDHPSVAELIQALKQNNVGAWVLSAPVVYLHHNTLGLPTQ